MTPNELAACNPTRQTSRIKSEVLAPAALPTVKNGYELDSFQVGVLKFLLTLIRSIKRSHSFDSLSTVCKSTARFHTVFKIFHTLTFVNDWTLIFSTLFNFWRFEKVNLFGKWGFNGSGPSAKELYTTLFACEPIEWNRIGAFQDVWVCCNIPSALAHPRQSSER